jgi:hypothetical protein
MTKDTDKDRNAELTTRTANYQSKVPADRLEAININDLVQTWSDETKKTSGLRGGGHPQPK